VQPDDMLSHLEQGNRMEQPDNCPDELWVPHFDCRILQLSNPGLKTFMLSKDDSRINAFVLCFIAAIKWQIIETCVSIVRSSWKKQLQFCGDAIVLERGSAISPWILRDPSATGHPIGAGHRGVLVSQVGRPSRLLQLQLYDWVD
jgi:hypothetical protein